MVGKRQAHNRRFKEEMGGKESGEIFRKETVVGVYDRELEITFELDAGEKGERKRKGGRGRRW